MIVILGVLGSSLRVEQVVPARQQLEDEASRGPHVGGRPPFSAEDNLRTAVLTRLDIIREVVI